jgi:hypothetical protein
MSRYVTLQSHMRRDASCHSYQQAWTVRVLNQHFQKSRSVTGTGVRGCSKQRSQCSEGMPMLPLLITDRIQQHEPSELCEWQQEDDGSEHDIHVGIQVLALCHQCTADPCCWCLRFVSMTTQWSLPCYLSLHLLALSWSPAACALALMLQALYSACTSTVLCALIVCCSCNPTPSDPFSPPTCTVDAVYNSEWFQLRPDQRVCATAS